MATLCLAVLSWIKCGLRYKKVAQRKIELELRAISCQTTGNVTNFRMLNDIVRVRIHIVKQNNRKDLTHSRSFLC